MVWRNVSEKQFVRQSQRGEMSAMARVDGWKCKNFKKLMGRAPLRRMSHERDSTRLALDDSNSQPSLDRGRWQRLCSRDPSCQLGYPFWQCNVESVRRKVHNLLEHALVGLCL